MARKAKQPQADPVSILEDLAANPETPAHARVAACRTLLALRRRKPETDDLPTDALTTRALRILQGGKK